MRTSSLSNSLLIIKDSTLREGLDVPNVSFSLKQRVRLATLLSEAGVTEIEVLAPGRVATDIPIAREIHKQGLEARITGLLYGTSPDLAEQSKCLAGCLDHVDLLVAASPLRKPHSFDAKMDLLETAMEIIKDNLAGSDTSFGVGFPNATQADPGFLMRLAQIAAKRHATRITIYDTNGSANPFTVFRLVEELAPHINVPLFFHGHNDLGMATANTLAAVKAGARGIEVTANGLGDRAGNCALEQIALCLKLENIPTSIDLTLLPALCRTVAAESGIAVGPLSPVTGDYVFSHKSPGHLEIPELFEAYDPKHVGGERKLIPDL